MSSSPRPPSSTPGAAAGASSACMSCVLDSTIVEFRPLDGYRGEFGFDWIRVKEAPAVPPENHPYIKSADGGAPGIVLSGYKDGKSDLTAAQAHAQLISDYTTFAINRPGVSPPTPPARTVHRHLTYFAPYLNLYPQGVSASPIPGGTMPPHQAKLQMIIDVKDCSPEKIAIAFDPQKLSITGSGEVVNIDATLSEYVIPKENGNYAVTPDSAATSRKVVHRTHAAAPDVLTITCLAEIGADMEVNVYAYPQACTGSTAKKLAGKLVVCANDRASRKTLKIVFVPVKTNINSSDPKKIKTGDLAHTKENIKEIELFYNSLYQALICPIVEYDPKNIVLNLSNDPDYKSVAAGGNGTYTDGTQIIRLMEYGEGVVKKFDAAFPAYRDYFKAFIFDETAQHRIIGHVSDIGVKELFLFKSRDSCTINHEALHGLGLWHVHREDLGEPVITQANKRYIFAHYDEVGDGRASTNIMGYATDDSYTSWRWRWQWRIAQSNC